MTVLPSRDAGSWKLSALSPQEAGTISASVMTSASRVAKNFRMVSFLLQFQSAVRVLLYPYHT